MSVAHNKKWQLGSLLQLTFFDEVWWKDVGCQVIAIANAQNPRKYTDVLSRVRSLRELVQRLVREISDRVQADLQ